MYLRARPSRASELRDESTSPRRRDLVAAHLGATDATGATPRTIAGSLASDVRRRSCGRWHLRCSGEDHDEHDQSLCDDRLSSLRADHDRRALDSDDRLQRVTSARDLLTPSVRLARAFGAGGMGSVWLADHLALHTQVVVKFMSTELSASPDAVASVAREASAAA